MNTFIEPMRTHLGKLGIFTRYYEFDNGHTARAHKLPKGETLLQHYLPGSKFASESGNESFPDLSESEVQEQLARIKALPAEGRS